VAHIMEHSVLCGSRKYPVKEPFIELVKGSLKTFLNAFTYPDKTVYPVASQNTQDFYNLVDVYLDAVFYPRITPQTLQQEGWHYELEDLDAPLRFKGVVFNEMKGAYSSPDSVLSEYSQQLIFPGNTYGLDSGGDPKHIPDLSYEQFKAFHDTYYHPSNAYIYFYGDDDPETRLKIINEYLKDFEALNVDSAVPLQPAFDHPRRITRIDSRYSVENFLRAKAHYLARGPLKNRDAIIIWGSGMMGRRLGKQIQRQNLPLTAFVDIDPKKIGRTRRRKPILSPDDLPGHWAQFRNPALLAAVGARGARPLIRAHLTKMGFIEGQDWWAAA